MRKMQQGVTQTRHAHTFGLCLVQTRSIAMSVVFHVHRFQGKVRGVRLSYGRAEKQRSTIRTGMAMINLLKPNIRTGKTRVHA